VPISIQFQGPFSIAALRARGWRDVPANPGAYRWYFPIESLEVLGITTHCDLDQLNLHKTGEGLVSLYFGIATNLSQRVIWHSAQKLKRSALKSGFLSTYRFSLLALTGTDYFSGEERINEFIDKLEISWIETTSKEDAERIEDAELAGNYHYPINIKGNHKPELAQFVQNLKLLRRNYKKHYLGGEK